LTEAIETSKPQQIRALAYQKQKSDENKHADPDTLKIPESAACFLICLEIIEERLFITSPAR
jgi:hypothetical protein